MDSLTYSYKAGKNQLDNVVDNAADVASNLYSNYNDLKQGQQAGNYQYDAIGNLTSDAQAGINTIIWTVYGKIDSIYKTDGTGIKYHYDVSGNRISKVVTKGSTVSGTYYVRDALGNVLSVYQDGSSMALTQTEKHLYGSSRLGMVTALTVPNQNVTLSGGNTGIVSTFTRGEKLFELSNHLGNVLVTLTDKKLQHSSDNINVDYYVADVASASDYYPFGMQMPSRIITGSATYRYGFNGKELDPNMDGNNYDYGFRIYNPQIGKFLSTDPLQKKYPELTPYQFASNTPIWASDVDGLEARIKTINTGADGKPVITVNNANTHSSADWKMVKSAMFGGFGGSSKASGFAWTSGYDSYNHQHLKAGNESGYAGPEGGTLTVDARGSVIKLSYEFEKGKNAPKGPQTPSVGESITMGAKGFYHIFIHGDNKAMAGSEEANNTIHNYLAGFMTVLGTPEILKLNPIIIGNGLSNLDDILGGEKKPLSSQIKNKKIVAGFNLVKLGFSTAAVGSDLLSLGKEAEDGYNTVKNTGIVLKDLYDISKGSSETMKSVNEAKETKKDKN